MLQPALKNTTQYAAVSLGYNCFPRWLLTRNRLKQSKAMGELSMPFDLAVHRALEVTKLLKTDFKDYFDGLYFDEEKQAWAKDVNRIIFIHDQDMGPDQKDALIERYKARINNFWNCVNSPMPILFMQAIELEEDVDNLYKELKRIRGNNPFEFVVIDKAGIVTTQNKDINVLKAPYPEKGYVWYEEKFYSSKVGQEFEARIIDYCRNVIADKLAKKF